MMGRTRKLFVGILVAACVLFGSGPLTLDGIRHAGHSSARQPATGIDHDTAPIGRSSDDYYAQLRSCAHAFDGSVSNAQIDICMHEHGWNRSNQPADVTIRQLEGRLDQFELCQKGYASGSVILPFGCR